MWYDLLVDSNAFLSVTQGVSTPYSWSTGQGCGYNLKDSRFSYAGQSEENITSAASGPLYYYDEGESIGVIDTSVLIADMSPKSVLQSAYFALVPEDIVKRVGNCNRPGGPITSLSVDDAKEVLHRFKKEWEERWSEGWDDESRDVTFTGFVDDVGVVGTTGR